MLSFTQMTGREDLYRKNVEEVDAQIEDIRTMVPEDGGGTYLLLHVSATKSKVEILLLYPTPDFMVTPDMKLQKSK